MYIVEHIEFLRSKDGEPAAPELAATLQAYLNRQDDRGLDLVDIFMSGSIVHPLAIFRTRPQEEST